MSGVLARRSWRESPEGARQRTEQVGLGIGGGEGEADASRRLDDTGGAFSRRRCSVANSAVASLHGLGMAMRTVSIS